MRLAGKIALVTGSSRGIGREIALSYAREGADVGINYISSKAEAESLREEIEALGRQALVIQADVSEEEACRQMVAAMIEKFGRIDILVNNAAYNEQCFVKDMPVAVWDRFIAINLRSVFLLTHFSLPYMLEQNFGRIINIGSQLGQKGGSEMSHYAAAKAGVIGFSKSLALELQGYNITVNVIAPGPVETDMLAKNTEEWNAKKKAELPLGRFGRVDEVAPSAVFLAAEPDGNIYTGQTLGPNCGDVML